MLGAGAGVAQDPPLSQIELPEGFSISVFADDVPGARSLAQSPGGTVFVGSRDAGAVYAVVDSDNDGEADQTHQLASGLNSPNGVAFRGGDLYVAEISRILRYDEIEGLLGSPPQPVVVTAASAAATTAPVARPRTAASAAATTAPVARPRTAAPTAAAAATATATATSTGPGAAAATP